MTYIPNLTPCTYGSFWRLTPLLAIGWLEPGHEFPRGTVKRATRDRLKALFSAHRSPVSFFGSHTCGFCAQAAGIDPAYAARMRNDLPSGFANILVPGRKVVYVVPELILHYIDAHQYRPPSAFTDAVGACPRMGSRGYFLALMATGGDMPGLVNESLGSPRSTRRFTSAPDTAAARRAALLWRNPMSRAWSRFVRSLRTGPHLSGEPAWEEVVAAHEARKVHPLPRQQVADFLLRVSNAPRGTRAGRRVRPP